MISAVVTGNLGRDAELKATQGGDMLLSFNVASNAKVGGEDVTTWVRCTIWGKRAESLGQYLSKGTKVAVAGSLSTREYEGKTYIEMRVDQLDFMGGGKREESETRAPRGSSRSSSRRQENDGDDIPF